MDTTLTEIVDMCDVQNSLYGGYGGGNGNITMVQEEDVFMSSLSKYFLPNKSITDAINMQCVT